MSRPPRSYREAKDTARAWLLAYLADLAPASSVAIREVRNAMHYRGLDSFLTVLLRDLSNEGLISVDLEMGLVYLLDTAPRNEV